MDSNNMLAKIDARLTRVESALDRITALLDQVQPTLAMAADITDDWVKNKTGGDALEDRLRASESALLQLTEPDTLQALVRIARLAPKLERAAQLASGLDDHVAMATDIADDWIQTNLGGDELEGRRQAATQAVLTLSQPQVLSSLTKIAALAPQLEKWASLTASLDDHIGMATDITDDWLRTHLKDPDERLQALTHTAITITDPTVLSALSELVQIAPQLLRSARVAAEMDLAVDDLSIALREEVTPLGAWGLFTALNDPEVRLGVGRVIQLTRHLGRLETLLPKR